MHISIRSTMLSLLFALSLPGLTLASDVQTILDQLINSYGGEENLAKMDSMVQEWDMVAVMSKRQGTDIRSIQAPNKLRVDLHYPNKSETRILNGDSAYAIFGDATPEAVTGIQKDAMRLQLMRLYSPLMLRNKIRSVSLIEEGGLLALSLVESGVHAHYMVNKENWRIEKVAGTVTMNGNAVQFLTEYSDFAVVEGVLIHHSENKFAGGMNTAKLQLRKVTFDAPLDNPQFQP
jgi:hypothetical protein